ncbi:MAG: DUF5667 domain-containing protein [Chloroflexota bacterium]
MNTQDEFVLDECLTEFENGEYPETCLPAGSDLLPLLLTAEQIRALPQPQQQVQAAQSGRALMLAALAQYPAQAVSATGLARYTERIRSFLTRKEKYDMKPVLRYVLTLLVVTAILAPSALMASAHSLPGDVLYPVKRAWEQVRLTFTLGKEAREALETQLSVERQLEEQVLQEVKHITPTLPHPVLSGTPMPTLDPALVKHLTETPVPPLPQHPTVEVPTIVSGLLTATPTWLPSVLTALPSLPPPPTDWPETAVWTMPPVWPTVTQGATWEPIPSNWWTTPTMIVPPEWLTATPSWIPPIPTDILTAIPTFSGTIPPPPGDWPTPPPDATWQTPDPTANPVPTYVETFIPTLFPPPPTFWPTP